MNRRRRALIAAAAVAVGGAGLWWAASRRPVTDGASTSDNDPEDMPVISQVGEPAGVLTQVGARPRSRSAGPESRPSPPRAPDDLDPRIDRGAAWVRSYLSRLLREPPPGIETSWRRERTCPIVRISRGQSKVMECWAYDGYIRAAVHHAPEDARRQLAGFPQVEVRPPNRSGYVTVYVRGVEGVSALEWIIDSSKPAD